MDQFNQFNQSSQSGALQPISSSPLPPPSPLLPPSSLLLPSPLPPPPTFEMLALPPLAIYLTREALFESIQSWSKLRGYAFTITRSLKKKTAPEGLLYMLSLPSYPTT